MTAPQQQPKLLSGIVKQVLSGDTVVIRNFKGAPPPEKTVSFSFVSAPKLAKRATANQETQDEPYAWEAREFLRKKLIGQAVCFSIDKAIQNREYGVVYLGKDSSGENVIELMVKEGYLTVRADNIKSPGPEIKNLLDLQEEAKNAKKGRFDESSTAQDHVRKINWNIENPTQLVEELGGKDVKAVIEHVRDGSTVRAFLLPDFHYVTVLMAGIRSPMFKLDEGGRPSASLKEEFAEEAKFFTEKLLLHQDVEINLYSVNGANFNGSILHPKGVIAEELLKNGYARFVDWTASKMKKADVDKLKQCEKSAKEKKLRIWKDWTPPATTNSDREFTGTVVEIINGDALNIKLPDGRIEKIFLASIRPPKLPESEDKAPRSGKIRALYDIPWMFEAREFLRKKLIGKKVNITVDYVQPARENMPTKKCCTVTISSVNVAEALVSKGLATVVKYRQTDDQRASAYDSLMAAELKASKGGKGVHAKKDIPQHRVLDCSGEPTRAKALFPHLSRHPRVEALVEYVVSRSRLRLYLPKDSSLVTFLLSGVDSKDPPDVSNEEPALRFVREKCMQREVEIKVESLDRAGNFIGWLWVDNVNLSVALVEEGLINMRNEPSGGSEYSNLLSNAKNLAISKGLWKYQDEVKTKGEEEDDSPNVVERKIDYKEVIVIEAKELSFYCQYVLNGPMLDALQAKMAQDMAANPPLPGVYAPKKGDICAAKFPADGMWYRARVEKAAGSRVQVIYIDYGNRAEVQSVDTAPLPPGLGVEAKKPLASFFSLALVTLPKDPDYRRDAEAAFWNDVRDKTLQLNVEYTISGNHFVTLVDPTSKEDIAKTLISEGLLLVEPRKEQRLQKLLQEYKTAQDEAKSKRKCVWEYGDITEDDDKEFGMGR